MIIFDDFIAGCLCGASGVVLLIMLLSYLTYRKQIKERTEVVKFINSLDEAAKTVIVKGDNNTDDSND